MNDPLGLNLRAWAERFRRPEALLDRAQALAAAVAPGSVDSAWAALHATLGLRAAGRRDEAESTLQQARAGFAVLAQTAGLRVCDALQALPLVATGRTDDALALLGEPTASSVDTAGPAAEQQLLAYAAQFVCWARAMALGAAGRWDEALRSRYASLQHARATGDDAAIAHALADLSSVQADLCNAEDALALATEAEALGERTGPSLGWAMAVFNRLAALLALQRHAEAGALAQRLLPQVDGLNPRNRESACLLLGRALLHAGAPALAETLLRRSLQERVIGHLADAALLQAELRLARGDAAGALACCGEVLGNDAGLRHAGGPDVLMLLHRAAATASERLGDLAGALRHARAETGLLAEVLNRGAQARRVALEIEHRLHQERLQREQAQQRQHAAEAERERLDALNRALAEASQAKTRFLAAASHDLRQPVQALAMNMAALQTEPLSAGQAQLVARMAQSLDALGRMFEVLLDISRLDAGIVPAHPQPMALRPLLQRLCDEHAGAASAAGLALRLRLPRGVATLPTRSDPALLERCLRNLLDNALKYTRRGGVLLAARAVDARHAPAGQRGPGWRLAVVDTGIGMTPEVQARVFEEFFQADNQARDRARGLGLGGAIVLRLCQLLGHPLQLHSRPGRGTRVTLWLPALDEPAAAVPDARRAMPTPVEAAGLCVLVIDDDADVRDSLLAVLRRWGHAALAGADADDALRHWQHAGQPSVQALVCDLRLPGAADGMAAVARLRQVLGADLPALVITGDTSPDRLQRLRDSGLPWLSKPVMPMRLRSWLTGVAAGASD